MIEFICICFFQVQCPILRGQVLRKGLNHTMIDHLQQHRAQAQADSPGVRNGWILNQRVFTQIREEEVPVPKSCHIHGACSSTLLTHSLKTPA